MVKAKKLDESFDIKTNKAIFCSALEITGGVSKSVGRSVLVAAAMGFFRLLNLLYPMKEDEIILSADVAAFWPYLMLIIMQ
jgi:hypothetical protein